MTLKQAAAAELGLRKKWTLALLGEYINVAREAGWLAGEPLEGVQDPATFRDRADEVVGETPMRSLQQRLGLTDLELDLLWMLACIELEPKLAAAAHLLIAPGMHELNAQVIESLLSGACESAQAVFERLARLGLIETDLDRRVPTYRRAVRPTDRVLELARGWFDLDPDLGEVAQLRAGGETEGGPAPHAELVAAVRDGEPVFVVATGVEGSGRATRLRQVVGACGKAVLEVRAAQLATEPDRLERQLNALSRECALHDAWPLLLDVEPLDTQVAMVERCLMRDARPVFATARESCTWQLARSTLSVPCRLPDEAQRGVMWRAALPSASDEVIDACARRYTISPGRLGKTAAAAAALARASGTVTVEHVHTALRTQLERRLLGLAERIETKQTWDDLVLPVDQFDLLVEMVARVRHRHQVLERWGFAAKVGRGLGLSALLSGPPGTGKTMIAGLIARELGLDLYQVDLSKVISKYIGETEKQLAALFEAAESGHAVLLFDEADSLFGKRTEVKSSTDRYANLEVNYLLQRMEAFNGISLLTTNHETAIDKAFARRLALHVRVPMPDEAHRASLWVTMMPASAERDAELDTRGLAAEFAMSGGYIKNAVLRAAYLAAHEGTPISNEHLWRAARTEYEAMGKVSYQRAS